MRKVSNQGKKIFFTQNNSNYKIQSQKGSCEEFVTDALNIGVGI